jgi:hypothetical protein
VVIEVTCKELLLGNPVFALQMTQHDIRVVVPLMETKGVTNGEVGSKRSMARAGGR